MIDGGFPRPPGPEPMDAQDWARDQEFLMARLALLQRDPAALNELRNDPQGCAMLMSLAQYGHPHLSQALATTYLAIAFREEPAVRRFLFGRLFNALIPGRDAALHGFLANYGDNEGAMQEFVAGLGGLSPAPIADLLDACFGWGRLIGVRPGGAPPTGVGKEAWADWLAAARSARLLLLSRADFDTLLFDIMRRDPDGPVERVLEVILANLIKLPPIAAAAEQVSTATERTVRDWFRKIADLHPAWPRIEDYIDELDTVAQRRLAGWRRAYTMFDNDVAFRQARVARRMAQFADADAVRRAFESMLLDRPSLYPKVRDEQEYYMFEPLGWRAVAWWALMKSHWSIDDAVSFARLIVGRGPWDSEARKSKEAIEAVVRTWPQEQSVLALLAETERRADIGAFVGNDIAAIRREAASGKKVGLDRYW